MKSVLRGALALALTLFCAVGAAYRFFPERFGGFFADHLGWPVVAGAEYSPGGDDPDRDRGDYQYHQKYRGKAAMLFCAFWSFVVIHFDCVTFRLSQNIALRRNARDEVR